MEKRGGNGRKGSGRGELGMYMYTRKEGAMMGRNLEGSVDGGKWRFWVLTTGSTSRYKHSRLEVRAGSAGGRVPPGESRGGGGLRTAEGSTQQELHHHREVALSIHTFVYSLAWYEDACVERASEGTKGHTHLDIK
jgi:hypothetical protein